ncbi:hypothetical protein GB931_09355 [Modestobacter sp. I12A-02628]|nr:hypothetical protein [Goekera deserti]MPQ98124.1 hypothetical protein [Goekera deserti]NDI48772.1 hypothetical protein [Goekera deserti]
MRITTPRDAEIAAERWLRQRGHADARALPVGPDQVKNRPVQVGRPDIQRLLGASLDHPPAQKFFFAASAYSKAAIEEADKRAVALFVFDVDGRMTPVGRVAQHIFRPKPHQPSSRTEPGSGAVRTGPVQSSPELGKRLFESEPASPRPTRTSSTKGRRPRPPRPPLTPSQVASTPSPTWLLMPVVLLLLVILVALLRDPVFFTGDGWVDSWRLVRVIGVLGGLALLLTWAHIRGRRRWKRSMKSKAEALVCERRKASPGFPTAIDIEGFRKDG